MNRDRISLFALAFMLVSLLAFAPRASAAKKGDLHNVAKDLAQNIARLNLHKIYVPDFLNETGSRTHRSALWGAEFSRALLAHTHDFEVVDRAAVQKAYDNLAIALNDLQNPEALARIGRSSGADSILLGKVVEITSSSVELLLSVREASTASELFSIQCKISRESNDEGYFPALSDPSGRIYYFPGYDGISMPKCLRCPDPSYTEGARRNKVQDTVLLTAIFRLEERLRIFG